MNSVDAAKSNAGSMLLAAPQPNDAAEPNGLPRPPVTSELLPSTRSAIERFARRRARLQFCRGLAMGILSLIVGMLLLVVVDYFWSLATPMRVLGTLLVDVAAITAAWGGGIRQFWRRDWTAIARSMEAATPPLRHQLLSAVELEDPRHANGSVEFRSSLQNRVAGELSSIDICHMLPWRLVRAALLAACAAVVIIASLSVIPSLQLPRRLARAFMPIAAIERASITQLEIIAPQPASKLVAQGDLIGVVAAVQKLGDGDVFLQWQSDDGRSGKLRMSPRAMLVKKELPSGESFSDRSSSLSHAQENDADAYAANLQIDSSVVHYRVLAGDAESNWYSLTPMARPRVVKFEKTYYFPAYAKLPDAKSVDEYGDLEALVGTRASVVVTFDQAVRSAQILLGEHGQDVAVPMQSVGDDPTRHRFEIAIQTPSSYRVDAISLDSELDNPFLPVCTIDPVTDRAPTAIWSASTPSRQIASSAAVLTFPGEIEDDLPMDRYVIESIVDSGPIRERVEKLDPATTQQAIGWNCDLMDINGSGSDAEALPAGALVRLRLIALDRFGKRGESEWQYIYIAGEQFDPKRHASLFAWQTLVAKMTPWFADLQNLSQRIEAAAQQAKKVTDADAYVPNEAFAAEVDQLEQRWQVIVGSMDPRELRSRSQTQQSDTDNPADSEEPNSLAEMMFGSEDSIVTDQYALMDRYATTTLLKLRGSIAAWQLAAEMGETLDKKDRNQAVETVASVARQAQSQVKQVGELPAQRLAIELAAALLRDWIAIADQTAILVDDDSSVPLERLPGQANLLAERFRQIDALIGTLDKDIPKETQRHLQNFRRFLGESIFRIERANETLQLDRNADVEKNFRTAMGQLLRDMQQHRTGSFAHGNTFNRIAAGVRELGRADQQSRAAIETLGRDGREWKAASERLRRAQDEQGSAEIAPLVAQEKFRASVFTSNRSGLFEQYDRSAARERVRPDTQAFIASDYDLARRVVEHVAESGFVPIANDTPEQIFERIAKAATVLEAGGQLTRLAAQLQDIADRERFGEDHADRAVNQGMRLEHYQVLAETPLQQLGTADIDKQLANDLQSTRWDSDFSQAREWITRRRYDARPFVSAAAPVQSLALRYRLAMPAIETAMVEARRTLRAFMPTTSELAKDAAEEAKQQRTQASADAASDQQPSATQEAEDPIDELQDKVNRLASDLVERANEANLNNQAERELARDADAALQKIQQQMEAVAAPQRQPEKSISPAEADKNLEQLTQTLEKTAAHFAAAEAGEELSQSRQELRENRQPDSLEQAFQDAESANSVTQTSPEELLRQLEKQLQGDPPMQANLSDISRRTVADVEQAMRTAAEQEDRIQRELEKADPQLLEQKKRLRDELRSLTDQSRAVGDQWLDAAERASVQAEDPKARETVRELRQELRSAADQADRAQADNSLLNEIQSASQQLQETLEQAAARSRELKEQAVQASDEEIHPNEKARDQRANQLEAEQRRTQNEWIKSLDRQAPQWRKRRDDAGRRAQQAEQQQRQAEDQLRQAEKRLQEKPDDENLKKNAREIRQRVEEAARAATAASATRSAAEQAEKSAADFAAQVKKQSVKDLDAKNPTAEMLARASEIAEREMQRLAAGLKEVSTQPAFQEASRPRRSTTEGLAKSQTETRRATQRAADDLERAARHEERLGNADAANQLEAAAKQLQETAESSVKQAQQGLQQAADGQTEDSSGEPVNSAHKNLDLAATQLSEQADALAALAESMPAGGPNPQSTDAVSRDAGGQASTGTSAEADRPEKLARALDELDRAIYASSAMQTQQADGQPGNTDGSEAKSAGSEAAPASGSEAASPTLAAAAEQAARRLAAQRQQRLSQIAAAGKPGASEGDPGQKQAGKPGSKSGESSQMPSGGLLDIDGELRDDGQWGALRERASDDMIQDRKSSVPLPYRSAIEAYFQTIAGEAARAKGGAADVRGNTLETAP